MKKKTPSPQGDAILNLTIQLFLIAASMFIIGGLVYGVILLDRFSNHQKPANYNLSELADLGTMFQGLIGSLWSLAGTLLIFVAFLLQKKQLRYQQEELELTRIDSAEQEKQIRTQNESIKRQNFESAFFQLMRLNNENVTQLSGTVDGFKVEGRASFEKWYNQIFRPDFQAWIQRHHGSESSSEKTAIDYYLDFYKSNQANFAHYFRTLYHIFKFVKFAELSPDEKKRYASLARAQLSANELAFLFYNGLSPLGEKFKPLIEEYGLLEHLDKDKLLSPSHMSFYSPKAFR